MSNSRDLTQGAVWRKLLQLAGPMMFGIIAVISVSLVDTYYVGRLGTEQLTALSFTFPVTMTVSSLAIGLGAGASSVVSRAVGSDDTDHARRLATDSLALALIIVSLVAVAGYFSIDFLFGLLGAQGEILDLITRYMQIWFLAIPFLVVPIVANAIVRATGDAFWPSVVMVGSALTNIAITPVFVFGLGPVPAFGIEGAAIGTLVAWLVTVVGAFLLVGWREQMIDMSVPEIGTLMTSWKRVLGVGIPAAIGNASNPVGIAVVTSILAGFGSVVVAGFGVATRIESLSVIPMLALSSAIGPFSGQNWGAGKCGRVKEALRVSYAVCGVWAVVLGLFFWVAAEPIVRIFSQETEVVQAAVTYLTIVPLSLWGYGAVIVTAGAFNALGRSHYGLGIYMVRIAALYIPASYIASLFFAQSDGVFYAIAGANALAGVCVMAFALHWLSANDDKAGAKVPA
ncbi:MATE family efflux transporter [Yoonia litorea]|uniref:Putative efflux protein, MATE family n=1 Tax=Yoonia litorea TaxID=1123755 RepID=A0A1I6LNT7_9RHOB|nr:MATE family efflux transporter [Yoonia litorea]SFS05125.1 putative efflux protein, MATE family [Yoonia litorea]